MKTVKSGTGSPLYTSASFYPIIFLAAIMTWSLHEYAHWQMGSWLGYQMRLTLNTATPADSDYKSSLDFLLIESAGPIFTIFQAILFHLIIQYTGNIRLFPFLFLPFFMRFLAFLVSFFSPNDEARIALELGLPFWTLPSVVTCLLAVLTMIPAKKHEIDGVSWTILSMTSFVAATFIIAADRVIFSNDRDQIVDQPIAASLRLSCDAHAPTRMPWCHPTSMAIR